MKKQNIDKLCNYVLSGESEYQICCDYIADLFSSGASRREARQFMKDHVWYIASKALNGKREAGKALTEMLNNVKENRKQLWTR